MVCDMSNEHSDERKRMTMKDTSDRSLEGRIALITGGGGGMGGRHATMMAERGADIIVLDLSLIHI